MLKWVYINTNNKTRKITFHGVSNEDIFESPLGDLKCNKTLTTKH